jgi:DNA-binding NtrC family response regulator
MTGTILCIEDEPELLKTLRKVLKHRGYAVRTAENGAEGLASLALEVPDLVITDLMMPEVDGMGILERVTKDHPEVPVILITAFATVETAIDAIRSGAYDYLPKPFSQEQLLIVVERALSHRKLANENQRLRQEIQRAEDAGGIIGVSPSTQQLVEMVQRVAPTDLGVLITGESGTGKEVVARALHRLSRRADKSFVPVDCAAIPASLLESELFGHEKGAFTGANATRHGLAAAADGGTFFLDEIGELEMPVQVKLLRLLQEGEFRRVGGTQMHAANLRFVAATNRDLEDAVATGSFREDLYHRLNVVRLTLAPLRDRVEDIDVLFDHFLTRLCAESGRAALTVTPEVYELLHRHRWPGNIRELMNCARYLAGLAEGPTVRIGDLPLALQVAAGAASVERAGSPIIPTGALPGVRFDLAYKQAKRLWLEHFEVTYIERLLTEHQGNVSSAARAAGIDRKSIQRLMKRNGMGDKSAEDESA